MPVLAYIMNWTRQIAGPVYINGIQMRLDVKPLPESIQTFPN